MFDDLVGKINHKLGHLRHWFVGFCRQPLNNAVGREAGVTGIEKKMYSKEMKVSGKNGFWKELHGGGHRVWIQASERKNKTKKKSWSELWIIGGKKAREIRLGPPYFGLLCSLGLQTSSILPAPKIFSSTTSKHLVPPKWAGWAINASDSKHTA